MTTTKFHNVVRWSRAWIFALAIAISSLNVTVPTFAHGGMEHITGTITNMSDKVITVKTTNGKIVQVHLDATTEYSRGKAAAAIVNLREGDRVVVHAMEMNGSLVAHQVKIGVDTKSPVAAGKATKK